MERGGQFEISRQLTDDQKNGLHYDARWKEESELNAEPLENLPKLIGRFDKSITWRFVEIPSCKTYVSV